MGIAAVAKTGIADKLNGNGGMQGRLAPKLSRIFGARGRGFMQETALEPPAMPVPVNVAGAAKSKDTWDKIDILGKLLGSILIPLAVAIAGFYVNSTLQDRSAKQKTVEIAVGILQSNSTATPQLKAWAEGVFNTTLATANQPLTPGALQELRNNPLPSGAGASDVISEFEGFTATPVKDAGGMWRIGFGHTDGVGPNTPAITVDQAKALLDEDMKASGAAIDRLVKVPLTPNQRDALVDFVWNMGVGRFSSSSLLQVLNAGQYDRVPDELRKFNSVGGRVLPGFVHRRETEVQLWNRP
jgi:lysozyme